MPKKSDERAAWHEKIAAGGSLLSALAAIVAAGFSACSSQTARDALTSNERTNLESERATLFSQFQEQYNAISGQFPARHREVNFKPAPGSADFARLEHYWFFCFSEWYETNQVNPRAFNDLWSNYYRPLVADGLEIPSLRYVLETRIRTRGPGSGQWRRYLSELAQIARKDGHPLDADVEDRISQG